MTSEVKTVVVGGFSYAFGGSGLEVFDSGQGYAAGGSGAGGDRFGVRASVRVNLISDRCIFSKLTDRSENEKAS